MPCPSLTINLNISHPFSPRPPPLKYLHLIFSFVSLFIPSSTPLSLFLLYPQSEFLPLPSSPSPLSILFGGGVLERCSVTANCLLHGAKRGGRGNLWEAGGPCCRLKSWRTVRHLNTVYFTSVRVFLSAFCLDSMCGTPRSVFGHLGINHVQ